MFSISIVDIEDIEDVLSSRPTG